MAETPSTIGMLISIRKTSGPARARQLLGLDAVHRLAHHFHVRLKLEQLPETLPKERVIVSERNANHGRTSASC